jgi:hypothetical protein
MLNNNHYNQIQEEYILSPRFEDFKRPPINLNIKTELNKMREEEKLSYDKEKIRIAENIEKII